jgi:hypothetical protein
MTTLYPIYGPCRWNGLLGTTLRPLIEVFPNNQAKTQECRRIMETFFC